MAIKAVLFDIDGTLVDTNDFHVLAWDEALRDAGHVFEHQALHDQIGKGADTFLPTLLPDLDLAARERLADAHGRIFKAKYLSRARPFRGARDLLARVRESGQRVVLASSASGAELDHYLDLLDARGLVSATTSADDVQTSKPAPDIFATALHKVAPLIPAQAIVVGDTPYDIEAAAKAGMAAVGVRSGKFSDAALRGAVALYDDVAALLAAYETSPLRAGA